MEMSHLKAADALPPGKEPGTHWVGDWVNPRDEVPLCGVQENLLPRPGIQPRSSSQRRLLVCSVKIRINKTTILPVVLYGCETWSLTFREKHRLRVFKNTVQRRIFELKLDKVKGDWRKLHNEELYNSYSSPIILGMIKSRSVKLVGHVARMGRWGMHIGYWWESQKERDH
jgi:hypothetical protein